MKMNFTIDMNHLLSSFSFLTFDLCYIFINCFVLLIHLGRNMATAKIARLMNVLAETKLEDVTQPSLEKIREEGDKQIETAFKMCSSVRDVSEVQEALEMVNEGFAKVDCFMRRSPEMNVRHLPVFEKVPQKYFPAFVQDDPVLRNEMFALLDQQKRKLGAHFLDNLPIERILDRSDCPQCTGDCLVQSARPSSFAFRKQTYTDAPLIVPCVTEASRKLKLLVISDFSYVSYSEFYFVPVSKTNVLFQK